MVVKMRGKCEFSGMARWIWMAEQELQIMRGARGRRSSPFKRGGEVYGGWGATVEVDECVGRLKSDWER